MLYNLVETDHFEKEFVESLNIFLREAICNFPTGSTYKS